MDEEVEVFGSVGVVTTNAACYSLSDDSTTYGYGISTNAVGGLDIMDNQQNQQRIKSLYKRSRGLDGRKQ